MNNWVGRVVRICQNCGSSFEEQNCGNHKYCSRKCYFKSRKGKPTWNKGLTKETDSRVEKLATYGMLGKKQSQRAIDIARENMEAYNNFVRTPLAEEKRIKHMSETLKRKYRSGELEHPRGMLGRKHSEHTKQLMREHNSMRLHPERSYFVKYNSDSNNFPKVNTSIERLLREELIARGIEFNANVAMVGTPDIVINHGVNIAIFCDGCYWHSCPMHHLDSRPNATQKDLRVSESLVAMGYKVLRFWEHEINSDLSACVDKIEEVMTNS